MGELKNVTIINAYYVSEGNLLGYPVEGDIERNKDQAANKGTELKASFVKNKGVTEVTFKEELLKNSARHLENIKHEPLKQSFLDLVRYLYKP